ncbi:hypothetical protein J2W24_002379 [Variovorax boronicumulans]|uniref:hypothetical protein n=1 Tax=Variovorax boronicumulans TaxID=436515 RepID=UPI0027809B0F|nr:hypothetical protein [Variovorax boronicumulans]MDP9916732.1 hypothetical protein [Variovorax boronicumulans]
MEMYGPGLLARTLGKPTSGTGASKFAHGNEWQYHSRSDRHSKIACWGLVFDMMRHCSLLREHAAEAKVGLGINHEMHDFRNNKKKNLDLVICTRAPLESSGGSKAGARKAADFAALASVYGIDLTPKESDELHALPTLARSGVSSVLVATEAKAAMTAHQKARPRLHDELTSSHQTIHGDNSEAIAAGIVLVNASETFISPDRNEWPLGSVPTRISVHKANAATLILEGLEKLQCRAKIDDDGFDAVGVVVIACRNDGSVIRVVTESPPAPGPTANFDYARFVRRLAQLYATRFARI